MILGLIPLDSRPCNSLWLSRLAKIADTKLIMYPLSKCGTLEKGIVIKEVTKWLKDNFSKATHWIFSIDAMCFGGLIQARNASLIIDDVEELFTTIRSLKKQYPTIKIYVFDTIMRTSITAKNSKEAIYWSLMNEYSKTYGRIHFFNDEKDKERLEELKKEIPSYIIDNFMLARNKKHLINMKVLNLLNDNVFSILTILQEDSMPYGIQAIEQEEINNYIETNKLDDKVFLYNGTDEGALILFSKILIEEKKQSKNNNVCLYANPQSILDRVHLFEDHKLIYNLNQMAKVVGINFTKSIDNSDVVLAIYGSNTNQDLVIERYIEIKDDEEVLSTFIKTINDFLIKNKRVIVSDLLFPNGGSVNLAKSLDFKKLTGYAAWNTSSNTLGTSFVSIALAMCGFDNEKNKQFNLERLIDDCYYQTVARRKANERLLEKNINIFSLKENASLGLEIVKEEMAKLNLPFNYKISLPWKRTFECDVEIIKNE